MDSRSNPRLFVLILPVIFCSIATGLMGQSTPQNRDQSVPAEKAPMAEDVFKNVQLLKGISVKEFMETMGFFSAALNDTCTTCHGDASSGDWARYADDPPLKQTARRMMLMVSGINKTYFNGQRQVTCYTCHRNNDRPKITPNLAEQYGSPSPEDPDDIPRQVKGVPSPDQVLEKYIQAVGGAQKAGTVNSLIAKGTYLGYDDQEKSPLEIYAKTPGQYAQISHGHNGDNSVVSDGRTAWAAQPAIETPVPVVALAGGDLDGIKLEGELLFPARITKLLTNMRTGLPLNGAVSILPGHLNVGEDQRDLTVVAGTSAGGSTVKLYFDAKTGLLVRMVRFTNLPYGFIPTQVDYDDYRDVGGIKIPFNITKTWVDGQSSIELSSVELNKPIEASRFSRPPVPKSPETASR